MNASIFVLLLKVSAILAAAALGALLLRNSSAAHRHFVWSAAMTSVVVLVLLQLIVPPIVVPVAQHSPLAALAHVATDDKSATSRVAPFTVAEKDSPNERNATQTVASSAIADLVAPPLIVSQWPQSEKASRRAATTPAISRGSYVPATASRNAVNSSSTTSDFAPTGAATSVAEEHAPVYLASPIVSIISLVHDSLQPLLIGTWLIGSLLLLLRLVIAHWELRRIARHAQVIDSGTLYPDVKRIATRLGIHRSVQLLAHERVTTPCTAGWRKPIILLPVSFAGWSESRQRAVFTHELAHIARNDSLAQTVASLACALFWFHPGFWMAARMMRGESERAADDCVINSGMAPVDYADHLIGIAEGSSLRLRMPVVALGMARASQLELRLRAMLNVRQSRGGITRDAQRVLSTAALMAIVPFAGLQARVQEPKPPQPRPKPPVVAPATPATSQPPAKPARVVAPRTPSAPASVTPAAATAPAAVRLTPPIVMPTLESKTIGLPKAPTAVTGPNQGGYIKSPPARSDVVPPSPTSIVATPTLPARADVVPPMLAASVAVPALPARSVVVPPMLAASVAVPALPARSVVVPPMPTSSVATPALPARSDVAPSPPVAPTLIAPPRTMPPIADTTYDLTIDAKPGDSLLVTIPAGGNVTVHGWDSNTAKLKASIGGKYWRETRVVFRPLRNGIQLYAAREVNGPQSGDGTTRSGTQVNIILRAPISSGSGNQFVPTTVDNEFELWVPRKTHVKFTSPIGALTLRDIDGDIDGSTKLGALDIANAYGKANLVTENGDVRVASSALTGSVHTGCGALSVVNSGNTLAATTALDPSPSKDPRHANTLIFLSGTVLSDYCRLKPRMSTERGVDERIPYGPLVIDSAPKGGTLSTRSGDITVMSSGAVLSATTSNANIDIRRMSGDITAVNKNGNVDIRVVNTNSTVHNAWIRASEGTVTIELPDSIDAAVDIEVTYTEAYLAKFKRPARIRDDRALPQTETAAWYRINDDPLRKAVRSKGTLGKGTGRIYIRVTDGDVVLKRVRA